jgi:hypothetical protein
MPPDVAEKGSNAANRARHPPTACIVEKQRHQQWGQRARNEAPYVTDANVRQQIAIQLRNVRADPPDGSRRDRHETGDDRVEDVPAAEKTREQNCDPADDARS